MGWGILGSIGRGVQKAGRGLLDGIDNAAMNSLTSGGLLDDALAPYQVQGQQQRQIGTDEAGQPMYSPQQEKQKWAPNQQEKRSLRGSYLMSIGAALQQGKPIGEGVQNYQKMAIGQIQAGQKAQQQKARQSAMSEFGQQWGAAKDDATRQQLFGRAVQIFGPEGAKQLAEGAKAFQPQKTHTGTRTALGKDGKPVQVHSWSDGSETVSEFGVLPRLRDRDIGGSVQQIDEYTGLPFGTNVQKTLTPGEVATGERSERDYGKPQMTNVQGQGLFSWDPNDPTKAVPVTGQNGKPIIGSVGNGEGNNRKFQNSDALRKEFNTLVQPYTIVAQAHAKIQEAAKSPTPAGDISLIYGYMKLLDPTSVVREGEFATAQNAGSIPDRIRAAYNRALDGTRLADDIRTDFVNQAGNIVRGIRPQLDSIRTRYFGISQNFGLDPNQVVYDPFAQLQIQPQQQGGVDKVYNPKTMRFEDK